jgi:hypothetical protein
MSKFSKTFCGKSPFKHAPEKSHTNREAPQTDEDGNVHHHKENKDGAWVEMRIGHDQGKVEEEVKPIGEERAAELTSSGDPEKHAVLLKLINKKRREDNLPEFKTLEEAIK